MANPKQIKVTATTAGVRLDNFLADKLGITRSQAQKLLENDQVLLNDKLPKKAGERIKTNDRIVCHSERSEESLKDETDRSFDSALRAPLRMTIIAETPDYLVVNKPSGMLTHSTNRNEDDSLAALLVKKFPKIKKVGDPSSSASDELRRASDPLRPGIVHRLDKEASGLLVVAKTQKMFDCLKEQFKNRSIEKEYQVLVHGEVAKDWSEINFPIKRGDNDRMIAIPLIHRGIELDLGKQARTEFDVVKRFTNLTLLRVVIHTGRMHQIRVHLLAYNHPVVGDPLYFQKKRPKKWDKKCGRLFLHCCKLGFVDLKGKKQVFESELPQELLEFLRLLK